MGWEVGEDTPKTEASKAPVPIGNDAVALLKAWRKAQMPDQAAMGPD
jgi:hypothetical protein